MRDGQGPSVQNEDRRRINRERKVLITERTRHINRIKGLLFGQGIAGYEPVRRDRRDRRERLEELRTGDGRLIAGHLRMQIDRDTHRPPGGGWSRVRHQGAGNPSAPEDIILRLPLLFDGRPLALA